MKTSSLILLAIGAYWLSTRTASAAAPAAVVPASKRTRGFGVRPRNIGTTTAATEPASAAGASLSTILPTADPFGEMFGGA